MNKSTITSISVAVDLQRDFFEQIGGYTGNLGVAGANDAFAKKCNELLRSDNRGDSLLVATQDFHPEGHVSFASTHGQDLFTLFELADGRKQMMWPDHCVQGTPGADLAPEVFDGVDVYRVFPKGTEMNVDSYGGILSDLDPDGNRIETGLGDFLRSLLLNTNEELECNIQVIEVLGLALDYCVGTTALQIQSVVKSLGLNIPVIVFSEFCRSVASESADSMAQQFQENGIILI